MNELVVEKTMTVKEVAGALGVSYDTANNCVKRLFPEIVKNGKTTYLTEVQVACISKELKNNNVVMDRLTFEVSSKVKNTTTDLEVLGNAIKAMQDLQILYNKKEAEYKAVINSQNQVIEEQKPKVQVYNSICDSETLQDLQTVASTVGIKNIFKVLVADQILEVKFTEQDRQKYYKPFAKYSNYFVMKLKTWTDAMGTEHSRPRVYVTGKGITWLTKKYIG